MVWGAQNGFNVALNTSAAAARGALKLDVTNGMNWKFRAKNIRVKMEWHIPETTRSHAPARPLPLLFALGALGTCPKRLRVLRGGAPTDKRAEDGADDGRSIFVVRTDPFPDDIRAMRIVRSDALAQVE